jgi:GcrA cell cycle regulator
MWFSDEYAEIAKKLWLENKTSGEIVSYFNGLFTRSQILGKLFRWGLIGGRRTKVLRVAQEQRARQSTVLKPVRRVDGMPFAKPTRIPTPSDAARRSFNTVSGPSYSLIDLSRFDCHWPLGDPQKPHFAYCSAPVLGNESYCAHHCSIAYNHGAR